MKAWKAALIGAGAVAGVAAAAGAAAYAVSKTLVGAAVDREAPEIVKRAQSRITGTEFDPEFLAAFSAAGEALGAKPNETVTLEAADGTRLVGHYFPQEGAKRLIVAMHGWRGSWHKDFGLISDFWFKSGCSVLFAEQRGQSASGGDYMGFGLTERYDCAAWAQWAANRSSLIPIYLCGLSMGATTVLMTASLELPERVHGIMADCGFTSPAEEWKHVMENNLHLPYALHSPFADAMFRARNQMRLDQYSTTDALAVTTKPVFLVHGTADQLVPVWMTYENYMACRAPKRLLIVPGADHGESYWLEREKYEAEATAFWKEFD